MSESALESLRVIELLDKHDKMADMSRFSPLVLQKKLNYYCQDRLRSAEQDAQSGMPTTRDLAALLSSVSARNSANTILPPGFVYSRLYVNDPLFRLARPSDEFSRAHNQSLGLEAEPLPNLRSVSNAVWYFELVAPLIRCGLLTVLPLEELHAPPAERPLFYSEDWFRSEVPEHLHDFAHKSAIISEIAPGPDNKGLILWDRPPDKPTRGVSIAFANDLPVVHHPFYLLFEQEVLEQIDDDHLRIAQRLDWDNPPDQELFDAWVYQSVNRTVINRIRDVSRELTLASELHATYLTESQFEAELCGKSMKEGDRELAVNFLNANAPYLKIDDPALLAKVKTENPRLFERWQLSVLGVASELTGIDDGFNDRAKQLFEKEIRPQLDELNQALLKTCGGIGGASLLTAGTIGMALLSNAALPFAAVLGLGALAAGGRSLPSVSEYISKRSGPAFVWSKLVE